MTTAPLRDAITRGQEASLRLDLIRAAGLVLVERALLEMGREHTHAFFAGLIEARHNELQKRARGEGGDA